MTKTQALSTAALTLRVAARKAGKINDTMAWDSIAVLGDLGSVKLTAKSVIKLAQKELTANGEFYPYS
jgi:hypothetical protein